MAGGAGAKAFGHRACWRNRARALMDANAVTPDFEVERLDQIPEQLAL